MRTPVLLPFALLLALAGCAGSQLEFAQLPQRDADLYPWAETREGVVVAVDEVVEPERVEQYFGANLLEQDVLPVIIVVSNRSDAPVAIGPGDVLLARGRTVIDPVPIARVAEAVGRVRGSGSDAQDYYARIALRQTVLAPDESYQGVLFFPRPPSEEPAGERDIFGSIFGMVAGGWRMNVGVTRTGSGERLYFGPFRLLGEDGLNDLFDKFRRFQRSVDRSD